MSETTAKQLFRTMPTEASKERWGKISAEVKKELDKQAKIVTKGLSQIGEFQKAIYKVTTNIDKFLKDADDVQVMMAELTPKNIAAAEKKQANFGDRFVKRVESSIPNTPEKVGTDWTAKCLTAFGSVSGFIDQFSSIKAGMKRDVEIELGKYEKETTKFQQTLKNMDLDVDVKNRILKEEEERNKAWTAYLQKLRSATVSEFDLELEGIRKSIEDYDNKIKAAQKRIQEVNLAQVKMLSEIEFTLH